QSLLYGRLYHSRAILPEKAGSRQRDRLRRRRTRRRSHLLPHRRAAELPRPRLDLPHPRHPDAHDRPARGVVCERAHADPHQHVHRLGALPRPTLHHALPRRRGRHLPALRPAVL
ncbi:unnamed protein product, partial [Mycena citricolor]